MKRARGFAKSRTGCQSCKDRKIKCDETKPECEACLRSGIRCPGYVRPLRWSRKHEMHSSGSATSPKSSHSHGSAQGESGTTLSHEAHPDFLSASLIEASCRMPDWLDLSLNGDETELAFQDATDLLPQDFSMTPPLLFPDDSVLPPNFLPNNGGLPSTARDASSVSGPSRDAQNGANGSETVTGNQSVQRFGPTTNSQGATNGPRALLHTFYRLSSPNSVRRLSDEDFVRHYFKHVCKLVSCFDSELNPFRSLTARWYKECPTVSYTIQSMAVAHIANWYPYMAQLCVSKRNQAWRSLQKDLQLQGQPKFDLDKALLCLFLLGISASWQPISSLGLQYLHIARNLIQARLRLPTAGKEAENLNDFWAGALVHWEMLASFVDPVPIAAFDGHGIPELNPQPLEGTIMPHPWTGIVNELQFVLAEVGRVARRRQQLDTNEQASLTELDVPWLRNLEQLLLSAVVPDDTILADYQDPATTNQHIIRTAQAYRQFGLMEIYRLNPSLLKDRINGDTKKDNFPFSFPDDPTGYIREIDPYLAVMAAQTLTLIADIPLSSGACRLHPLLLVACASQLQFPDATDISSEMDADERPNDITQNRYLVEARMFALSRKGPQGPILKAINIIKEVWDRLDNGHYGNWIDVMHEKGWQAILA